MCCPGITDRAASKGPALAPRSQAFLSLHVTGRLSVMPHCLAVHAGRTWIAGTAHCCLAFRYFETDEYNGIPPQWWFGGGSDITPCYVNAEDMQHFHGSYKVGPLLPAFNYSPMYGILWQYYALSAGQILDEDASNQRSIGTQGS